MTKLSDIQLVLLTTAAARVDGSLLPPPDTVAAQTARIARSLTALLKRELVIEVDASTDEQVWREEDARRIGLAITAAGRAAVGIEAPTPEPSIAPASDEDLPAKVGTAPARATKSDTVLALLRRAQGATLAELVEATGWLPHTTRAALTGLRKKGHAVARGKRGETSCYSIGARA